MSAPMPVVAGVLLVLIAGASGNGGPIASMSTARADTAAPAATAARPDVPERNLIGDLKITRMRIEGDPAQASQASAYVQIQNRGSAADRLIGASVDIADRTTVAAGADTTREAGGGLAIAPGGTLDLTPGGPRLVLAGLRGPLKEGDRLKGSLRFERAGPLSVEFTVETTEGGAATQP